MRIRVRVRVMVRVTFRFRVRVMFMFMFRVKVMYRVRVRVRARVRVRLRVRVREGLEIRRRIIKAGEVCRSLRHVWAMKGLPMKLKGRLFAAFVLSVLLYNSEVWVIGKEEMKALEGKVVYLMRKVVGEKVKKEEGKLLSNQQLREMLGLEPVKEMIRRRRLQWVAHSARRGQDDFNAEGHETRGAG